MEKILNEHGGGAGRTPGSKLRKDRGDFWGGGGEFLKKRKGGVATFDSANARPSKGGFEEKRRGGGG